MSFSNLRISNTSPALSPPTTPRSPTSTRSPHGSAVGRFFGKSKVDSLYILLSDYIKIPSQNPDNQGESKSYQTEYVQLQFLLHKADLFKRLCRDIPAEVIHLQIPLIEQQHVIRQCNNYLLKPDSIETIVTVDVPPVTYVHKFTYHGVEYHPMPDTKHLGATRATFVDGYVCTQNGAELNCDFAMVSKHDHYIAMAIADGCNLGHRSRAAAVLAVQVALSTFDNRMNNAAPSTLREIVEYQLSAFDEVQKNLEKEQKTTSHTTLLLACVVHEYVITASLGDTKAYLTRRDQNQKVKCFDISDNKPLMVVSEGDPGGFFGYAGVVLPSPQGMIEGPDLRSLRVGIKKTEPGDMIHMMTDGTHSSFEMNQLGVEPKSFAEKQDYMCETFSNLIQHCQTPDEVVNVLNIHVELMARKCKLAKITGQMPISPGKPDHSNSIHLRLK